MDKAAERRLIFENLANGVGVEQVARDFGKNSIEEVMVDFRFVALKIKSYAFARLMPYIALDSVEHARQNRFVALTILAKLNLEVVPMFSSIKGNETDGKEFIKS